MERQTTSSGTATTSDHPQYCPECGGQRWKPYNGHRLPTLCRCQVEWVQRKHAEDAAYKADERRRAMDRMFREANIGVEFTGARLSNFEARTGTEDGLAACRRIVDDFPGDGVGLLLYGGTGNGKSRMAASVVGELLDCGIPAVYQSVSELFKRIKQTYDNGAGETENEIYWALVHAPLLVLDDVGAQYIARKGDDVSWAEEQLYAIVDARVRHHRPMIITANTDKSTLKELEGKLGARTYDRIIGACRPVLVSASSYRRKVAIERMEAGA